MLSKEEVVKIAKLARLELTEEEIEKMRKDLSGILDHFNSLQKVKEKPQGIVLSETAKGARLARQDQAVPQTLETNKNIIESFPDKKGTHNKVKAIF
jgi:aspartyl-tRNA(Asn)/glutamyl-tRNA(Gln) amidotransferase subunit C